MRALILLLLLLLPLPSPAGQTAPGAVPHALRILVSAYPDRLCGARADALLWCDGTEMPWDDGRAKNDFSDVIDHADLEDQFRQPYPAGPAFPAPPPGNHDPGRIRHEPFFRKMYGADRQSVERNLAPVKWPFASKPTVLRVTRVNGVNTKLEAVIRELRDLPAARDLLSQPVGAFHWRPIAGTGRLSMHSFGIAVDLGGNHSDYWLWDLEKTGSFRWRNRIPWEIVAAFERHGFIWGGKWHHYDTMHFEYRPELLPQPSS